MGRDAKRATIYILVALLAGMIFGVILYTIQLNSYSEFVDKFLINGVLALIGDLFANAIRMMVVPLVFLSITLGAASMVDLRKFGLIGLKTATFYFGTTVLALILAIIIGTVVKPGENFDVSAMSTAEYVPPEPVSFVDTIANIIPSNVFDAFVDGNMLQLIFVGIFFGIVMAMMEEQTRTVKKAFIELELIVIKIITIIMKSAPIGVFALITVTFATLGGEAIISLASYFFSVLGGCILQVVLVYSALLLILGRVNPLKVYKKMLPVWAVAFSTSSSSATLPVTMDVVEKKLGVDPSISSFTLPLGSTINMDATAIMQAIAILFIAQAYGVEFTPAQLLMIIVVCTLASIGTAGVPSAGIVVLSMILPMFGLPVEMLAIILSVDRILDMVRTVVNVTGDAACTLCIAKSEDAFDESVFLAEN